MKDIIQSYFSGEAVRQLGQAASLDATVTQRALSLGLPLQLDALAAHLRHHDDGDSSDPSNPA